MKIPRLQGGAYGVHPVEDMRKIAPRTKTKALLSQINVTPLVDVMLVLLIIFMVTAPMMHGGIDLNLPKVKAGLKMKIH